MSAKTATGLLLGAAFLVFLAVLLGTADLAWPAAVATAGPGTALWQGRTADVILQVVILFTGVLAILLVLGSRRAPGVEK